MRIILIVFLFYTACWADSKEGTYCGEFMKVRIGARSAAMGGVGIASPDIETVYLNPASLTFLKDTHILLGFTEWLVDTEQCSAAISIPAKGYTFVFGLNCFDYGKIEETTREYPKGTGREYSADSLCATFVFAKRLSKSAGVGGSLSIVREQIDDVRAEGVLTGLGAVYHLTDMIFTGCAFTDLTVKDLKFINKKYSLPQKFWAGIAYRGAPFSIEVDISWLSDEKTGFGVGCEYVVKERLALRAGYSARLTHIGDGVSIGVGFLKESIEIRYAFLPSEIESIHYISMVLSFGERKKRGFLFLK
jgi:hypothetical protein